MDSTEAHDITFILEDVPESDDEKEQSIISQKPVPAGNNPIVVRSSPRVIPFKQPCGSYAFIHEHALAKAAALELEASKLSSSGKNEPENPFNVSGISLSPPVLSAAAGTKSPTSGDIDVDTSSVADVLNTSSAADGLQSIPLENNEVETSPIVSGIKLSPPVLSAAAGTISPPFGNTDADISSAAVPFTHTATTGVTPKNPLTTRDSSECSIPSDPLLLIQNPLTQSTNPAECVVPPVPPRSLFSPVSPQSSPSRVADNPETRCLTKMNEIWKKTYDTLIAANESYVEDSNRELAIQVFHSQLIYRLASFITNMSLPFI
jgi:hypothetical protein